jgi:hypothetical protein
LRITVATMRTSLVAFLNDRILLRRQQCALTKDTQSPPRFFELAQRDSLLRELVPMA